MSEVEKEGEDESSREAWVRGRGVFNKDLSSAVDAECPRPKKTDTFCSFALSICVTLQNLRQIHISRKM